MALIENVTMAWTSPRIITIPDTVASITLEDLNDTLQDIEDSETGIARSTLREASGKTDLGGDLIVGLTIKLLNLKVKFANRSSPTVCKITGGNLCAVDANGQSMYPIEYSTNVSPGYSSSVSATIIGGIGVIWDELSSEHTTAGTYGKMLTQDDKFIKSLL